MTGWERFSSLLVVLAAMDLARNLGVWAMAGVGIAGVVGGFTADLRLARRRKTRS